MFCDWFSFGSCEELAIVWVRSLGFRKGLRVCEELLFEAASFRKLFSLLFTMIFGSQYAPHESFLVVKLEFEDATFILVKSIFMCD
jgi:hypothetical protein